MAVDGSARALLLVRGPVLKALVQAGHEVVACASLDRSMPELQIDGLEERFAAIGVRLVPLAMNRQGMNPFGDLRALLQLVARMRDFRPDAVLSYSAKSASYGSLAARIAFVPRSYAVITGLGYLFGEDSGLRSVAQRLGRGLLRLALRTNRRVIFQNPDDRALFVQRGLVDGVERTAVVGGSGVDIEHFAPCPLPSGPPCFLLIARMQVAKGVLEFVKAARLLRAEFPAARFQLLGPFDDHPTAIQRSQLETWLSDGSVEYLGATSDVRPFIAESSVFVLPSYREGTPRSTLEAMAMGRPVVTTDVPGCRETVRDGDNGFLVPARSVDGLAEGMRRLLRAPALLPAMGARSRAIVEERFSTVRVAADMLRALDL